MGVSMRIAVPVTVAAALLLAGCGGSWTTSEMKPATSSPGAAAAPVEARAPADVVVTEGDITDRPYTVIGDITVSVNKTTIFHPDPTREMVTEALQREAAGKGADAVILARYGAVGIGFMSWGTMEGKGRAVVFNK